MADWSPAEFLQLMSSPLKRQDSELRWILVVLTVAFLGEVGVGTLRGGAGLLVVLSSWLVGLVLFCVAMVGFFRHRYSEGSVALFVLPIVIFQGWSAIAAWVAIWTSSPSRPLYYLGVIEASAVVPLLAGIYLMSRRLTPTS
ncbi:MAG TPA: hypothetical protein VGF78_09340 [Candidatus Dormibacteraeota bacterium]